VRNLARTRSVAFSVAWRGIHNAFTNPAFLLPSVLFPLFFFIAFAGGLSGVQNAPNFDFKSGYTSFQFAFVCVQAAAFGGVFTGFAIAADFEFGFARRLLLAAPNHGGIVLGYMIAAMVRAVFVLAVVFVAGLISGMHVDGSLGDLLALLVLALAVSATSTLWAAGIAMRMRTMQAGPVMQMPVFILLFLAPRSSRPPAASCPASPRRCSSPARASW
jgi:ABC-2 type transport system permease protein